MTRRARPLLGTLVDVAADEGAAVVAAFDTIAEVQAALSRFEATSDIGRFHALPAGGAITVGAHAAAVLAAAHRLHADSDGIFDIALGTAGDTGTPGWRLEGRRLWRLGAEVRLDLGGIAKGYAVDRAIEALQRHGSRQGWVNAGGDLRVFGDFELPVAVRDERRGGARPFGTLADGALATSWYAPGSRSALWSGGRTLERHVSVAAPTCLWADALTKIVAVSGHSDHPLLARHGARAWLH